MSPRHAAFAVRAVLRTPLVASELPFEALLLAASEMAGRRLGSWRDLPLASAAGGVVPAASAGVLETGPFGAVEEPVVRKRSLRLSSGDGEGIAVGLGEASRIDPMSPLRPALRRYRLLLGVRAVWWSAVGDPEAVMGLLDEVTGLGAMAGQGYGEIDDVEVRLLADPGPAPGVLGRGGQLLRRMPEGSVEAVGWLRGRGSVAGPAWLPGPEIVMVPDPLRLRLTRDAVRGLLGVG